MLMLPSQVQATNELSQELKHITNTMKTLDVFNYLDSWVTYYSYWLEPIDAWLKRY